MLLNRKEGTKWSGKLLAEEAEAKISRGRLDASTL
jgi:hypothetical protein